MLLKCDIANEIWLLVFFFMVVGFKVLKECFLILSTSQFISVHSQESIMITFYNKLPVPKVICQDCIAHPNCTRFLRHLRADERVHTQHMQNGGLSYAAWPAKDNFALRNEH